MKRSTVEILFMIYMYGMANVSTGSLDAYTKKKIEEVHRKTWNQDDLQFGNSHVFTNLFALFYIGFICLRYVAAAWNTDVQSKLLPHKPLAFTSPNGHDSPYLQCKEWNIHLTATVVGRILNQLAIRSLTSL